MSHPSTLRKLAATTATLLVAGALTVAQAAEKGKLLIWINGDKGYNGLQKVGDEFTKKTGVKVVVEHPEDAPGKFQAAAEEGKGPDIWIWAHDRVGEWADSGVINAVTPGKKIKEQIDAKAWQAFTIKGKVWAYPVAIEAVSLIYNKNLIKTPPKTFEEIFALDKKFAAQGKKAILWDYTNTYFTMPMLAANGGYAFKMNADGTYDQKDTGVNNAGAVIGAELLTKMVKEGVMPKGATYADMEAQMAQGKLAMMISGPWAWDNLKKAKINFGVAKLPSVAGKPAKPFVGYMGAMITKAASSAGNVDIAREFIENNMLTLKGLETINADVAIGAPANKAAYAKMKNDPFIQVSMASATDGVVMPNNPRMGRFWAAMVSALNNMTEGRQTPKEALDAAAKRILK
ncbi:maltose/maltodextrin ABC transporter substrate-binding protein MalE [Geothrix alkalitolerans]|uniref:maltose/maltodextrin ABC transporter substrate-binding protein MalE n=1 Tax=Geothrix alkalitolerans TaxID=2922724 RepID=UPI001FAF8ACA